MKSLAIIILLGLVFLWIGCTEDDSPVATNIGVTIGWHRIPPNLEITSGIYFPIQAIISELHSSDVDSVKAIMEDDGGIQVAQCRLYDDANAVERDDALDFCSPFSGDLVAQNGIFSRQMNGQFAPQAGSYQIYLEVWWDGNSKQSADSTIIVAESTPPVLSELFFPTELPSGSGFPAVQIHLKAVDNDILIGDSITSVSMTLYSPSGTELELFPLLDLGNDRYGMDLRPHLAAGYPSGDYAFAFRAYDTFETSSDSFGITRYMENLAPNMDMPQFDDEVELPPPGYIREVLISVLTWDDQLYADVDSVNMLSYKPDGTYANDGNPIPLVDNGEWGDFAAGDSVFSITAVLYDTSLVGDYVFTFWARDFAGNKSEDIIDTLVVTP